MQTKLFQFAPAKTSHGGSLGQGRRKCQRPLVPRRPVHVVLRSSQARGDLSLLRPAHRASVRRILKGQSARHVVAVLEFVNVGNHLHLKVKARTRSGFRAFLISTTAMIARAVTGARRGRRFGKFWDALAFTRVLQTDFEEKILARYFNANALEAEFGREIRRSFLKERRHGLRNSPPS